MDGLRVGLALRAVRLRKNWRQVDVAQRAGVSQSTVSDLELGRVGSITVDTIRRIAQCLDVRVELITRWRGGELDRLMNTRHASLASAVTRYLQDLGWAVAPEVSFAIYGERGWIDILAWHEPTRTVLVVEVKTELVDVHDTLGVLDRKTRLAPKIARDRGWRPTNVATWLVIAEGSTNRHHVERFAALLRAALPATTVDMRRWLRNPSGRIAALTFFSNTAGGGTTQETRGRRRVRTTRGAQHRA